MREAAVKSGALRHRVQVQRPIETANSFGEREMSWETLADVDASIEPLNARELFAAQQVQSQVTHKVTMRFFKGLAVKMRLLFHDYDSGKDRVFHIDAVTSIAEVNRKLVVMCREEV